MTIIEKSYAWTALPAKRQKTDYIVFHHVAGCGDADSIHRAHLANGWLGIGYHFYIRKDGSIYRARPIDTVGAHTTGYNSVSVGVCFEGNFETETMNDVQKKAGGELAAYLKNIYPCAKFRKHGDFNSTACPGRHFPFEQIICFTATAEFDSTNEIVGELARRGIMTNTELWLQKCSDNTNAYHLARKIANMTRNAPMRSIPLESINDIVWELSYRGIITDKALWLRLMNEDKNLYWLGYKAANLTQ